MLKILAFFPETNKSFLYHILYQGWILDKSITKGSQGVEVVFKDLPERLPVPPFYMPDNVWIHFKSANRIHEHLY